MDVFKGQFVYKDTSTEDEWWHCFDPSDLDDQDCTFQASKAPLYNLSNPTSPLPL